MILGGRRVAHNILRYIALRHPIRALFHLDGNDRGHGLDIGYVDFPELLHEGEDSIELALEMPDLLLLDGNASEMRNPPHGLGINGH